MPPITLPITTATIINRGHMDKPLLVAYGVAAISPAMRKKAGNTLNSVHAVVRLALPKSDNKICLNLGLLFEEETVNPRN